MTNAPTSAAEVPTIEPRHRMRIALEHAGVTMGEMAHLLDVSGNTVGNYLAGRTTPSTAVLRVWAMRCGVPLDWIRYGTANSNDTSPGGGSDLVVTPSRWNAHANNVVELRRAA